MSSKIFMFRMMLGLLLVAVLAGCSTPTPTSTPTLIPTEDIQPTLNTVRTSAAMTVIANLTLTAPTLTSTPTITLTSTGTSVPSNTPLPSATATVTFIPRTQTPTPTAYECSITSTSPTANTNFAANTDFDAVWVVKNIGTQKWISNDIDIHYFSGTRLQKTVDVVDLGNDVASGESYKITIDMRAPADIGTYTTTWVIVKGDQVICNLPLTIVVQ
jgi:hypothetical protein